MLLGAVISLGTMEVNCNPEYKSKWDQEKEEEIIGAYCAELKGILRMRRQDPAEFGAKEITLVTGSGESSLWQS